MCKTLSKAAIESRAKEHSVGNRAYLYLLSRYYPDGSTGPFTFGVLWEEALA